MEQILKKAVWLMIGFLFAYIAAASAATGTFHPSCFYDAGEIDVNYSHTLAVGWSGTVYQTAEDDVLTVTEDTAVKYMQLSKKQWNYMVLDMEPVNKEKLTLELTACDQNWNPCKTQAFEVKKGKKIFEYTLPKCKNLMMRLPNQKELQFRIKDLQFREKLFIKDKKKMAAAGAITLICYILCSAWASWLKKKKDFDMFLSLKKELEDLFSFYLKLVHKMAVFLYERAGRLARGKSGRLKSMIRIAAMSAWMFLEIFMRGYRLRIKAMEFHYWAAFAVLAIFIATSLEERPKELPWKNKLVSSWFWTAVIMAVSGVIVPKKWPLIGVLFLTLYAVWFWIWGNMKKPDWILADIAWALKIAFWVSMALCVFGRSYASGIPYSGIYANQNVFAAFLNLILAVNLSQLKNLDLKQKVWFNQKIWLSLELCLILFFLARTQSRGGLLTGITAIVLYFLSSHRKWLFVLLISILFFPVACFTEWAILRVQAAFPYRILYVEANEDEGQILDQIDMAGETVFASAQTNRLTASFQTKSLDEFTSGRMTIWKVYLRKINLWGHFDKETINGIRMQSHNALMYMIYLYGILICIPYVGMWWMLFIRAAEYSKKRERYCFLPLAVVVVFFSQAMTDTLEEPFFNESWILVYVVIGVLFCRNERGNRVLLRKS